MFLRRFNKTFYNYPKLHYSHKNINIAKKRKIQNVFAQTIESNISSSPDWKQIRTELLENQFNRGLYSNNNIDSIILGYFINEGKYDLCSNYISFLKEENVKPNLAFVGKYLKFLYKANEECIKEGKQCKEDQQELILNTYDDVRLKFPVLDSFSLENSILALSLTDKWKVCIDLLKEIKITDVPNSSAYSCTVAAAFLNKEEKVAWQLLREMVNCEKHIENNVYLAYINSLKELGERKEMISKLEQLLLFLQENDIVWESEVSNQLMQFCKKTGLRSNITSVTNKGICQNCHQNLKQFQLTNEEFENLKTKIFDKVIIGKDIFVKTNPQELERFNNFLAQKNQFDVVLDGLNIAYSVGTRQPPRVFAALLAAVVSYFAEQNKEVLVVGRNHMINWPKKEWNYIKEYATVFLAQDISQDDPYLLYCALSSGIHTTIVTKDFMRSQKFLLRNAKYKLLFNRWLSQNQCQLIKVVGHGKPVFRHPVPFTITTQKIGNCWHIPFKQDSGIGWLCMSSQVA